MRVRKIINIIASAVLCIVFLVIFSYVYVKFINTPLVDPEVERIITADLVENNKSISVPEKLDMNMGESKTVYLGIKNDKNNILNYRLEFDIFEDSQSNSQSYKSVLKYQGVAKSLEEGMTEVGKADISIPQSDFSKGDYILKVSIIDEDLNEAYASGNIALNIR